MVTRNRARTSLVAVGVTGIALAAAIGGVTTSYGENRSGPSPKIDVTAVQREISALTGPVVTTPKDVSNGTPTSGPYAADITQARAVPAPKGAESSDRWYLVPGADAACLGVPDIAGACATAEQIQQGRLNVIDPQARVVRGVVADDVTSVEARQDDGRSVTAAVEDNVYYLDATSVPKAYTLVFHRNDGKDVVLDGRVRQSVPDGIGQRDG